MLRLKRGKLERSNARGNDTERVVDAFELAHDNVEVVDVDDKELTYAA